MKKCNLVTTVCISGCLALTSATQVSAEALKPDLQYAVLASLLTAIPAIKASAGTSMDITLSASYREDNLDWNIAGNGVNILSELAWKNLAIAQLQAAVKFNMKDDWRIRAELGYGTIISGTNQDSDYDGNNRTQEFSRSNNKAGGDVRDASIALGKTFRLLDQTVGKFIYITPYIGLSAHQQNLTMTNGVQTIPATGPFAGLASAYDAQWRGPWIGFDAIIETGRSLSLIVNAEYHLADYSAQANWNLRDDFAHPVSFKHSAKGRGIVLTGGTSYPIAANWTLNTTFKYQDWVTRAGNDRIYFSNGSVGSTRLNAVNWESMAYNLEIVHQF